MNILKKTTMQYNNTLPVVLCGGSGSRLWPFSRSNFPKQFLPILENEKSLFQNTIQLTEGFQKRLVLGNIDRRFIIADQLLNCNFLDKTDILLEPCSRNTFAVSVVACLYAKRNGFKNVLLLPSDHFYDKNIFLNILSNIGDFDQNSLYTFGIEPDYASSEYGYIKYAKKLEGDIFEVDRFVEKPSQENAEKYLKEGNFCFNSGIFILPCDYFLELSEKFMIESYRKILKSFENISTFLEYKFLEKDSFESLEDISIDYAIMEKTNNIKMIKCPKILNWNDLGSYKSIYNILEKDKDLNVLLGHKSTLNKTKNSMIINKTREQRITVSDLEDLLVVSDDEDIFISKLKKSTFDFKDFLKNNSSLKAANSYDLRPWGKYENILEDDNFKIKKIIILPMKSISLQLHKKRNEHWIIVQGKAEIICDSNTYIKSANESIYIEKGVKHKIKNLSEKEKLIFIEVQYGEYLGEDDIVRFDDEWGRK